MKHEPYEIIAGHVVIESFLEREAREGDNTMGYFQCSTMCMQWMTNGYAQGTGLSDTYLRIKSETTAHYIWFTRWGSYAIHSHTASHSQSLRLNSLPSIELAARLFSISLRYSPLLTACPLSIDTCPYIDCCPYISPWDPRSLYLLGYWLRPVSRFLQTNWRQWTWHRFAWCLARLRARGGEARGTQRREKTIN